MNTTVKTIAGVVLVGTGTLVATVGKKLLAQTAKVILYGGDLMEIAVAILLTSLTGVTALWMNERIQRNNVEERNKKLRKNLRRSND